MKLIKLKRIRRRSSASERKDDVVAWLFPKQEYLFRKICATDDLSPNDELCINSLAVTRSGLSDPLKWLQGHAESLKSAVQENCNKFRVLQIAIDDQLEFGNNVAVERRQNKRNILHLLMSIMKEFLATSSRLEELRILNYSSCKEESLQLIDQAMANPVLPLKHISTRYLHLRHWPYLQQLQSVAIGMDNRDRVLLDSSFDFSSEKNSNHLRRLLISIPDSSLRSSVELEEAIAKALPTLTHLEELQIRFCERTHRKMEMERLLEKALIKSLPSMCQLRVLAVETDSSNLIEEIVKRSPSIDQVAFSYYGAKPITLDISKDLPRNLLQIGNGSENVSLAGCVPTNSQQTLQTLRLIADVPMSLESTRSLANLKRLQYLKPSGIVQKEDGGVERFLHCDEVVDLVRKSDSIVELASSFVWLPHHRSHNHWMRLNRVAQKMKNPQTPLGLVPHILARLAAGEEGKPSLVFSALRDGRFAHGHTS